MDIRTFINNKKNRYFIITILIIAGILYYFVIPTTDYYKVTITPNSVGLLTGTGLKNDVDIQKVDEDGSWEETVQFQRTLFNRWHEDIRKEIGEYRPHSGIDGKLMALNDFSNRISILISIKHTRNLNIEDIIDEIKSDPSPSSLERIQSRNNIEINVALL